MSTSEHRTNLTQLSCQPIVRLSRMRHDKLTPASAAAQSVVLVFANADIHFPDLSDHFLERKLVPVDLIVCSPLQPLPRHSIQRDKISPLHPLLSRYLLLVMVLRNRFQ